ncbi:hypothetical protein PYCC9005_001110 [Savitreella phatthalungensis]
MVNQDSAALIDAPLDHIQSAFADALALGNIPTADNDYGIPARFEQAFSDADELAKVPWLKDGLTSGARLVRCACYVVHSDTEIYAGAWRRGFDGWALGRYGLDGEESGNAEEVEQRDVVFEERLSLRCRTLDGGDSVTVKLYNEKEDGLLHGFIDVVGIVCDNGTVVHGLVVEQQRLASYRAASKTVSADHRSSLIGKLTQVFGGDDLAAELVLLSMISGVATREPVLVGPLPLCVRGVSPAVADALASVLRQVAPLFVGVRLDVPSLNSGILTPHHDGEDFTPGALQAPADSLILIDETRMDEGKLTERGIRDLQSLSAVMDSQKLPFAFPFNRLEIPVDVAVIAVSTGKSLLPAPTAVTVTLSTGSVETQLGQVSLEESSEPGDLALASAYISAARLKEGAIPEDLSVRIQDDFVRTRQRTLGRPASEGICGKQGEADVEEAATLDGDELALRLRLARELAKSRLSSHMSWEDYVGASELAARLRQRQQQSGQ